MENNINYSDEEIKNAFSQQYIVTIEDLAKLQEFEVKTGVKLRKVFATSENKNFGFYCAGIAIGKQLKQVDDIAKLCYEYDVSDKFVEDLFVVIGDLLSNGLTTLLKSDCLFAFSVPTKVGVQNNVEE